MGTFRKWAAFHEAGHAVAYVVHHIPIECVRIYSTGGRVDIEFPTEEDYMRAQGVDPTSIQSNRIREIFLTVAMAGPFSQFKAYTFSFGNPMTNISGDTKVISDLMDDWVPSNESREMILRRIYEDVQALLRDNWSAIESVAQALLRDDQLSGERVVQIVNAADK